MLLTPLVGRQEGQLTGKEILHQQSREVLFGRPLKDIRWASEDYDG